MIVVTLTDRPKSVRKRCVIEMLGGVFVLSRCFLDFSVDARALVIELSWISSTFSCVCNNFYTVAISILSDILI